MARWAATKTTCGTYHYAVVDSSFIGTQATTTVAIAGDMPTERRFVGGELTQSGTLAVTSAWDETGPAIGTHDGARAAKTMEELYRDCQRDVLSQDPAKNEIMFAADDRGVLQSCWYVPHGCQDDCTSGVTVSDFACGALDPLPPAGSSLCNGSTDHTQVAAIHVTASTNSPAIDVAVFCDGSAARTISDPSYPNVTNVMPRTYDPGSPEVMTFLADADAVADVSTIPIDAGCPKSVSFGTVTTVSARGQSSGDLQCLANPTPAAAALANDCKLLSGT
jgi:hypothetical protein